MRPAVGICIALAASCGGGSGGNPDAAGHTDAAPDAVPADAPFCPAIATFDPATASELTVAGDTPSLGIFDPSIVYPATASGGAMAYSAVPSQETIRTHLAVSADHGATWTYVAEANAPEAAVIASTDLTECPSGACSGNLISEVSSLIFDADEPDGAKRWKLFAHRYLVGPNVALHYRIGTITLQTAAQPTGPWTAPQKLIGWSSPSTYTSTGVVANVTTMAGSANDCLALTEPGAIWLPGVIDLAVGCVYLDAGAPKIRVELLRSPDHGTTWGSVSTLLRADDAACSGLAPGLNGADLFAVNGTEYVVATPSDTTGYRGCMVFPVADIAAGTVERDAQGRAVVSRAFAASPFDGACTFADGAGGYAIDVGFFTTPRPFRIYRPSIATP
jgi:hypothetical protein